MPVVRFFVQPWDSDTWNRHKAQYHGAIWTHTASNEFGQKKMQVGDVIYIMAAPEGRLHLAGRIVIGKFMDQDAAETEFPGTELYKANCHVLACDNSATAFDFDRPVLQTVARALRFVKKGKDAVSLVFRPDGRLDPQTLRKVRELTPESAEFLDDILGQPPVADPPENKRGAETKPASRDEPTPPLRRTTELERIIRDTAVTQDVKRRYRCCCQVCGQRLETPCGPYAEGAHVRPLGSPHGGPDIAENVLCLCPNHHVLFDTGAFSIADDFDLIGISGTLVTVSSHRIGLDYLRYHREHIFASDQQVAK